MRLKLWGVRGSYPTSFSSFEIKQRISEALKRASAQDIGDDAKIRSFINKLPSFIKSSVGGHTSCAQLDLGDKVFIFDAGTGIIPLGNELNKSYPEGREIHILLSHTHWDHIHGFPFFSPNFNPKNKIYVHSPAKNIQERFKAQQYPQYFPITVDDYPAKIEIYQLDPNRENEVGGIRINNMRMYHPNSSYAFSIRYDEHKFVYCTDAEFFQKGEDYFNEALDFFRDADLLVIDTQYLPGESVQKLDWGHSSLEMSIDMAVSANVKQMISYHHEPRYDDKVIYDNFAEARKYLVNHYPKTKLIVNIGIEGDIYDI